MSKYRFAGVPQKISFNSGALEVDFIPDTECVVQYHKDKDTELKFFVLTSESAECIGMKFENSVTLKVVDGKLGLFSVGVHMVVELEEVKEPNNTEVTFGVKLSKNNFRIVSLAK